MRILKKQISLMFICFIGFLLLPGIGFAEGEQGHSGEMRLKIDRIGKDDDVKKHQTETELEKVFPELFHETTRAVIESQQEKEERLMAELSDALFTEAGEADTTLKDIEKTLFTEDYTAPKQALTDEPDQTNSSGFIGTAVVAGLAGLATILCVAVYMMMRRMSD